MIIESLVRLGSPFLEEGGLTSENVIYHITDVASPNTRNFFQNICLVEMDEQAGCREPSIIAHPLAVWGDWITDVPSDRASKRKAKEVFKPALSRTIGIPFALPAGGNPLARQGCYPLPAYPVYEASLDQMTGNESEVLKFLEPRAEYTVGWSVSRDELARVAKEIAPLLPKPTKGPAKTMAVIVIVDYRSGPYAHNAAAPSGRGQYATIAASRMYSGESIVADLDKIVESFWASRLKEAEEKGSLDDGVCSFCGRTGRTVSSYAKSWPMFSTTYSYPLPQELPEDELVKSIGLCTECYKSLVFGASLFHKTVQAIDRTITKELFSLTQSVRDKPGAEKSKKVEDVYGSWFALPVLDGFLRDRDAAADFIAASTRQMNAGTRTRGADLSLKNLLGFEAILSEAIDSEVYRLTIVYYIGNWSQGAVDLVAVIQDVVPSIARAISGLCSLTGNAAVEVGRRISDSWGEKFSDSVDAVYGRKHSSLPYNLALAYGSSYLWQSLDSVLHKRPLSVAPFVRNVARRLQERAAAVSITGDIQSRLGFRDEVVFFLAFSKFLDEYHTQITGKGELSPMGRWQEWIGRLNPMNCGSWVPESVAEVGFAAGTVTRAFARQYYAETKKDFIRHRVMTFGADLRPADIFVRSLSKIPEYALRLDLKTSAALREASAAVSMAFLGMSDEINKSRDSFMAAFWAGYQLAPQHLYPGVGRSEETNEEEVDQRVER